MKTVFKATFPSMQRMGSAVAHDALSYALGAVATTLALQGGKLAYQGGKVALRASSDFVRGRLLNPQPDPLLLKGFIQKELDRLIAAGELVRPTKPATGPAAAAE